MASNFQLPSNIKEVLDKQERFETLHFRSQGGDSRGLLVGQYHRSVGGQHGDWGVAEYVDVYLDKVKWELVLREVNENPVNNLEVTFKESSSHSVTNSTETTVSLGLGFEKIFKFSMGIEDKRVTSVTTGSEKGIDRKHTLIPGQTAYVYRRTYEFNLSVWWAADLSNVERVVTQDATTNNTHGAEVKRTITGDDRIVYDRREGEDIITLPPADKERDNSPNGWKDRIRFSDLYAPAKAQVAAAWKRAVGGSETEVMEEALKYKQPTFQDAVMIYKTTQLRFMWLFNSGIRYPPLL